MLACIYTSKSRDDYKVLKTQNLCGIEECDQDFGKINFNKSNFLNQENLVEVHLHPTQEGAMALSPNNCCFLANMSMPFLKFELMTKQIDSSQHAAIFEIVIITNDSPKCELLKKVMENLQAINYLGTLSDL